MDMSDISRLSPAAQRQILEKLGNGIQKHGKYRNEKAVRIMPNGKERTFDSQKEARRYDVLMNRLQRGQIRDLRLQVDFTLQEAYTDPKGSRVRAIRYKADFTYYQPPNRQLYGSHAPWYAEQSGLPWEYVVEDVKGVQTKEYKLKKKLMQDKFGIAITEV